MELEDNIEDFTENIIAELVEELEDVIKSTSGNWNDMLSYVKYKEEMLPDRPIKKKRKTIKERYNEIRKYLVETIEELDTLSFKVNENLKRFDQEFLP